MVSLKKIDRRDFIKNVFLAGAGIAIAPNYMLSQDKPKTYVDIFNMLPIKKQGEIIKEIGEFSSHLNYITYLDQIDKSIDTIVQDEPGTAVNFIMYHKRDNKIHNKTPDKDGLVIQYLTGWPFVKMAMAHEKMHSVQDQNSFYDKFDDIMNRYVKFDDPNGKGIILNPDAMLAELKGMLGNNISDELFNQRIETLKFNYQKDANKIEALFEIQAYTITGNFSKEQEVYDHLKSSNYQKRLLSSLSRQEFSEAYEADIMLVGLGSEKFDNIISPKQAAQILGKAVPDVKEFYNSVVNIANKYGSIEVIKEGHTIKQLHQLESIKI